MNKAEYHMQLEVGKVIGEVIATFLITPNIDFKRTNSQRVVCGTVKRSSPVLLGVPVFQFKQFNTGLSILDNYSWSPPQRTWKSTNQEGKRLHQYRSIKQVA